MPKFGLVDDGTDKLNFCSLNNFGQLSDEVLPYCAVDLQKCKLTGLATNVALMQDQLIMADVSELQALNSRNEIFDIVLLADNHKNKNKDREIIPVCRENG